MAQVSTTTPGSKINDAPGKVIRTRSRFPQVSRPFYNTHRFGVYHPFEVIEGVEGDKLPIRSSHEVQSYTLKAPLMQTIRRNKDFFEVPMQAILPNNWEKFYENPNLGDDVADDVGCGVQNFWPNIATNMSSAFLALVSYLNNTSHTDANKATFLFRWLVCMEMFYSNGNLISALGCHCGHRARIVVKDSSAMLAPLVGGCFDDFFDGVVSQFCSIYPSFTCVIDGDTRLVNIKPDNLVNAAAGYSSSSISMHDFLEYLRDDLSVKIDSINSTTPIASTAIMTFFDTSKVEIELSHFAEDYNLSRLWAYQLACCHFYSNDVVDYVYTAGIFRQLISYYVRRKQGTLMPPRTFTYNGLPCEYDAMSAKYFTLMCGFGTLCNPDTDTSAETQVMQGYLSALFSYRRSLRFVDYFTGSRTRPLAVGNVDVNVVSNKVNVVDVTRNIQVQRFLNQVNRTGRKWREYIRMMGGTDPGPDYHDPLYLGHTADTIFGREVENTGVDQLTLPNSVTSRLASNGSRYQFEVDVDCPCVIIGISYYDIERVYVTTTDRQLHHMNRFDMFNPFMQFIGDQSVNMTELGTLRKYSGADYPFGYQTRHMEYKQRFPVAAGGFVRTLPGYIFDNRADDERNAVTPVQSPDFIRSLPGELDRFFVSLTGFSLGTYYHFIVKDYNYCDASRPMAYAPSIL